MQKERGGSSGAAALQLQKELKGPPSYFSKLFARSSSTKDIMNDRLNDYCNVVLENDNIFDWSVYFLGPKGTDYEGVRVPSAAF